MRAFACVRTRGASEPHVELDLEMGSRNRGRTALYQWAIRSSDSFRTDRIVEP